jgi:putative ABC transport system permease protein
VSILKLALKNIRGNGIRSLIIFLCVMGVAVFFVSTTLIIRGAENSLNQGIERLGADIMVVPQGSQAAVEGALLMGKPTQTWMSVAVIDKVKQIPGVDRVSPQIFMSSLYGASCCAVSEMFMVIYDPETDFTIRPFLDSKLGRALKKGETIGGSYIFTPEGQKYIKMYGYDLTLVGNLTPTGTGMDQTMFFDMETGKAMAAASLTSAQIPMPLRPNAISSLLVKVKLGVDRHKVANQILLDVGGVTPIESANLFGTFRQQMVGLLWGLLVLLSIAWVLSAVLIGLVFSIAANERQREISVLRSLGATHSYVFGVLIAEAALLALSAGVLGVSLGALGIFAFRDYISASLGMPFLFPSAWSFMGLFGGVIALSLLTVGLGSMVPAIRIARQEPALAMRE